MLTITPDIHMTFLTEQAKEFRSTYRIGNSIAREARSRQKELIVEEFKEYQALSAEASSLTMVQYLSIPFIMIGLTMVFFAFKTHQENKRSAA